ncbi:hypothetical protein Ciccas_013935, partial [Cichlidogyrus casuarinus]
NRKSNVRFTENDEIRSFHEESRPPRWSLTEPVEVLAFSQKRPLLLTPSPIIPWRDKTGSISCDSTMDNDELSNFMLNFLRENQNLKPKDKFQRVLEELQREFKWSSPSDRVYIGDQVDKTKTRFREAKLWRGPTDDEMDERRNVLQVIRKLCGVDHVPVDIYKTKPKRALSMRFSLPADVSFQSAFGSVIWNGKPLTIGHQIQIDKFASLTTSQPVVVKARTLLNDSLIECTLETLRTVKVPWTPSHKFPGYFVHEDELRLIVFPRGPLKEPTPDRLKSPYVKNYHFVLCLGDHICFPIHDQMFIRIPANIPFAFLNSSDENLYLIVV